MTPLSIFGSFVVIVICAALVLPVIIFLVDKYYPKYCNWLYDLIHKDDPK